MAMLRLSGMVVEGKLALVGKDGSLPKISLIPCIYIESSNLAVVHCV